MIGMSLKGKGVHRFFSPSSSLCGVRKGKGRICIISTIKRSVSVQIRYTHTYILLSVRIATVKPSSHHTISESSAAVHLFFLLSIFAAISYIIIITITRTVIRRITRMLYRYGTECPQRTPTLYTKGLAQS